IPMCAWSSRSSQTSSAVTSSSRRKGWASITVLRRTCGGQSTTRRSTCKAALHHHPRGHAEALVALKRRLLEAARLEQSAVVFELEPDAQSHPGKPAPSSLAFGFVDERSRDTLPPVLRIDGEPADVERAVFFHPQDDADHCPAAFQDCSAAAGQVIGDRARCLVQGR